MSYSSASACQASMHSWSWDEIFRCHEVFGSLNCRAQRLCRRWQEDHSIKVIKRHRVIIMFSTAVTPLQAFQQYCICGDNNTMLPRTRTEGHHTCDLDTLISYKTHWKKQVVPCLNIMLPVILWLFVFTTLLVVTLYRTFNFMSPLQRNVGGYTEWKTPSSNWTCFDTPTVEVFKLQLLL